eukprot:scaffold201170_cov17-Prasinocladus_malaysianus.AAC.1
MGSGPQAHAEERLALDLSFFARGYCVGLKNLITVCHFYMTEVSFQAQVDSSQHGTVAGPSNASAKFE